MLGKRKLFKSLNAKGQRALLQKRGQTKPLKKVRIV